jgi:predicted nucleic acid-binding protein
MTPETSVLGDLPDVNVWLSLTVKEHAHHLAAQQYWHETAADRVMFNRVTMLGLVRLLMVTFDQDFRRFAHQDLVILVLGSASPGG